MTTVLCLPHNFHGAHVLELGSHSRSSLKLVLVCFSTGSRFAISESSLAAAVTGSRNFTQLW